MNGFNLRVAALIIGTLMGAVYVIVYANRVKKDPSKSIILESKPYIDQKFCNATEIPELTTRLKVVLVIFFATFGIMIWGVVKQGWWFGEMTAFSLIFLCMQVAIV